MQFLIKSAYASRALALGLLLAMMALRIYDPAPLEILRLKTFDLYQVMSEPEPSPGQVVIVDIDEKSLGELGQWPWPRTLLADLVNRLSASGAAVITFDVLFPEADRTSPQAVAAVVESYDKQTAERLRQLKSNDEVLAAAIGKTRVVLGQSGYHEQVGQAQDKVTVRAAVAMVGPDPSRFVDAFPDVITNVPVLEQAAQGRGLVTIRPERDGVVRKLPLISRYRQQLIPSLGLETLRVATGQTTTLIRSTEAGVESVVIAGVTVPTDRNAKAWLHFRKHDPKMFVSAADVLSGKAAAGIFQNRIVMVGTSATGLFDLKATPVDSSMPGVEAHAQLINAILTQSLLSRPAWAVGLEVSLTLLIGLLLIVLLPRAGAMYTIVVGATIAVVIAAGSWFLFASERLVFDYAFPLLTSGAVSVLLIVLGYLREELDRRQIRTAFGQYLSSDMVEQLAENPDQLSLGGETREMSIMFSDVRGFTTISESYKSNPRALTTLINSLLTPLSIAVVNNGGTIDKYMGDNIMAFWNAPLSDDEHALHACQAALEMSFRLNELNRLRVERSEIPLEIGIGINTGECVVGNMGSDLRFDYTVLGDTVNLASRLEGQTKGFGVQILIGHRCAELVANRLAVLPVSSVKVKGKTEYEDISVLLGDEAIARSPGFKELARLHASMLEAVAARRWDDVLARASVCQDAAVPFGIPRLYERFMAEASRSARRKSRTAASSARRRALSA